MTALAATLTDDNPHVTIDITAPDGRVLSVQVGIPNLGHPADEMPDPKGDAFVVFLDTEDDGTGKPWEPISGLLRVNVNDGAIWNYPGLYGWNSTPEQDYDDEDES